MERLLGRKTSAPPTTVGRFVSVRPPLPLDDFVALIRVGTASLDCAYCARPADGLAYYRTGEIMSVCLECLCTAAAAERQPAAHSASFQHALQACQRALKNAKGRSTIEYNSLTDAWL